MRDSMFSVHRERVVKLPFVLIAAFTATVLVLGASSGCRTTRDNQIDLLERELRAQEDYIYQLEDYLAVYSQKLRQARSDTSKTVIVKQDTLPTPAKPKSTQPEPTPRARSLREEREPRPTPRETVEPPTPQDRDFELPDPAPFDPEELEAPDLDLEIGEPIGEVPTREPTKQLASTLLGTVKDVSSLNNDFDAESSSEAGGLNEAPVQASAVGQATLGHNVPGPSGDDDWPAIPEIDEFDEFFEVEAKPLPGRKAQKVLITQLFRGGTDGDTQLSSFLSVIEARDESDQMAAFDGAVSLMIMTVDEEKPRRVKRWDFTEAETVAAWQSSHLGEGLHLELPLVDVALPDEPIELWVRLVTSDGRKLLAELPFDATNLLTLDEYAELESASELRLVAAEDEDDALEIAEVDSADSGTLADETATDVEQPRWRAASQRFDSSPAGTSSSKGKTWTSQSFSRSESKPAAVASRKQPQAEPPRVRIPASSEWKTTPIR